mmetsp:Transcript_446/g.1107  ORF Transcript_446/g.1107 Transcript_446/m.1107 type:complete len:284 (+) Transcript_446:597-1448(+)
MGECSSEWGEQLQGGGCDVRGEWVPHGPALVPLPAHAGAGGDAGAAAAGRAVDRPADARGFCGHGALQPRGRPAVRGEALGGVPAVGGGCGVGAGAAGAGAAAVAAGGGGAAPGARELPPRGAARLRGARGAARGADGRRGLLRAVLGGLRLVQLPPLLRVLRVPLPGARDGRNAALPARGWGVRELRTRGGVRGAVEERDGGQRVRDVAQGVQIPRGGALPEAPHPCLLRSGPRHSRLPGGGAVRLRGLHPLALPGLRRRRGRVQDGVGEHVDAVPAGAGGL